MAAGQHVDRPVDVPGPGQVRKGPELPGLTGVGVEDVVEVDRFFGQQVAAPQGHAVRCAAAVVPQVEDQRVGSGHQFHRRRDGRPGVGCHGDPAQVEVADVAVQPLHPADAEVVQLSYLPHGPPPGRVVAGFARFRLRPAGSGTAAQPQPEVLVSGLVLQVPGHQLGERDLVQVVVLPGRQPGLDRGGGPLGDLGKHVVGAQQRQGRGHDLPAGHLLRTQRAVVRHADPRRIRPGVVEGELQQPGRRQPQRKLAPHLIHPGLMGFLPLSQGLLVAGRLARRRDEHPDHQLSRPDRRVIAMVQQHGPLHRSRGEPILYRVVDDPLDLILRCPFHGASHPCHCLNGPGRMLVPRQPSGRLRRTW